jgi:glycosyltransferase involved in cell wall biosynthesis
MERFEVVPMRAVLQGWVSRHAYVSPALPGVVRRFRPDAIQVEAEPWSAVYAQMVLLRRLVAPTAKMLFFTWWNTPRQIPIPFRYAHRACLEATDLVIAGNHGAEEILRGHGYEGPVEVAPQLGVDTELFRPREKNRKLMAMHGLEGAFVVGYVGRLTWRKGVDLLVEAAARVGRPDLHVVIVGDGPEREELERKAAALGIAEHVIFTGVAGRAAIPGWLSVMDVLVLPSRREQWEQFGHVLIEAMACGVPVIGTNSGEIPYVMGDVGQVVPMEDVARLAEAIDHLARDEDFHRQCRERGLRRVESEYSHVAVAQRLARIYRRLNIDGHHAQD